MEKLNQNLQNFEKALNSLEELRTEEYSIILRDATIQRFEYTVELFWKTLKSYLLKQEGIDCSSPKKCIREAASLKILDPTEAEQALQMIDDRNLVSHSYLEEIAAQIYDRSSGYTDLMKNILLKLSV